MAQALAKTYDRQQSVQIKEFSSYQKFVIAMLAFLQFTIILDFMMMSPLGAVMMPALNITPKQFGFAVSAYAFSGGCSALCAAGFADRFDRKKFLLFFYCGFVLGTLFCGVANSYTMLLCARMVTGVFAGVMGSIILAITTDLFPLEMRGRVMGYVQTAFAASQIMGLPVGLYLSNLWGWHAPFLVIVGISVVVGVVVWKQLKPIDSHLSLIGAKQTASKHLVATLLSPHYRLAFILTLFLSLAGFMLMPFGSAFTVHNLGIPIETLPLIYLVSGFSSIISGPVVGRAADFIGKYKVFCFGGTLAIIIVGIYTNLGTTPLALVMFVNVILFVSIFSRIIPAQALISAIPEPAKRGSFMSVNSALQQLSGGVGSVLAGLIVSEGPDHKIVHFNIVGYIIMGTVALTMVLMYFINKTVTERTQL